MNKVLLVFTLCCVAIFSGCTDNSDNNGVKPSVSMSLKEVGETTASFSVSIADAKEAAYLCVPASDEVVSVDKVFAEGKMIKNLTVTNIKVEELNPATSYKFFLAARNGGESLLVSESFQTDGVVAPPSGAEVLDIKDGFLAYDGLDEASGHYRLNVYISTKKMNDDTVNEYTDVTLWVYCKYPLEVSANSPMLRVVPSGNITPFYTNTDGQGLTDMMYYIGKHVVVDGEPNASGTALYKKMSQNQEEIYVADDTDNSKFEIKNNGDGTYTVTGVIADKTKGKSFFFNFTKEGEVFDLTWGQ